MLILNIKILNYNMNEYGPMALKLIVRNAYGKLDGGNFNDYIVNNNKGLFINFMYQILIRIIII